MKRLFLLLLLISSFTGAMAQVKVSDLTTYSGDASEAWVMAVINSSSRKVLGKDLARGKIDSLTISNDSAFVWRNNGTKTFAFKLTSQDKVILNQYAVKQVGSARLDSGQIQITTYGKQSRMLNDQRWWMVDRGGISSYSKNDSSTWEGDHSNPFTGIREWNPYKNNYYYTRYGGVGNFLDRYYLAPKAAAAYGTNYSNGSMAVVLAERDIWFDDSSQFNSWGGGGWAPNPNVMALSLYMGRGDTEYPNKGKGHGLHNAGFVNVMDIQRQVDTIGHLYGFWDGGPSVGGQAHYRVSNYYSIYNGTRTPDKITKHWGIFMNGGANQKNYFAGPVYLGDTSALNADVHKLYVAGSSKFAGNIIQPSGRTILGAISDDGGSNTLYVTGGNAVFTEKLKIGIRDWGSTTGPLAPWGDNGGPAYITAGGQQASTFFGHRALKDGTGNHNQNTAFGFSALEQGGGGNNDAFGAWALRSLTGGSENSAFGRDAMAGLSTGSGNVALGLTAGYNLTTGGANIFIGRRTGWGISTGSSNIVVGDYIQSLPSTLTNTILLGEGVGAGTRDNATYLGRSNQTYLTVRPTTALLGDTSTANASGNGIALYAGNGIKVGNKGRNYVYAGDDNNWNMNYSPLMRVEDNGKTAANIKRGTVAHFQKSIDSTIGSGPWGNNVYWPSGSVVSAAADYNVYKGNYTLVGGQGNYDNNTVSIGFSFTPKEDSTYWNVGNGLDGMIGLAQTFGVYGTGRLQQFNGSYYNNLSFFRNSVSHADSYVDKFYHYATFNLTERLKVKYSYGFYMSPMQTAAGYVLGRSWGMYQEGTMDHNYFGGKVLIGDTSMLNADVHKLYVAGSSKLAGNAIITGRTLLGNVVDDGITALQIDGNIGIPATNTDSTKGVIYQSGKRLFSSYGTDNYFVGRSGNHFLTGTDNVTFGNYSFRMATTAGKNIVIGNYSLDSIQSGNASVAIGYKTLGRVKAGRNVAVGYEAFRNLSDASSDNTGMGVWVMEYLQSGSRNTAMGEDAGAAMVTGSDNTFLGYRAAGSNFQNATLNGVIAIGTNQPLTGTLSNTTLIGNGLSTTRSDVVIIGNSTQLFSLGKVPPEYADNAAAKAASLQNGDVYRTGDFLKVVHD